MSCDAKKKNLWRSTSRFWRGDIRLCSTLCASTLLSIWCRSLTQMRMCASHLYIYSGWNNSCTVIINSWSMTAYVWKEDNTVKQRTLKDTDAQCGGVRLPHCLRNNELHHMHTVISHCFLIGFLVWIQTNSYFRLFSLQCTNQETDNQNNIHNSYSQSTLLQSCHGQSHGGQRTASPDRLCRRDPPHPGPSDCPPVHSRAWPGPGTQHDRRMTRVTRVPAHSIYNVCGDKRWAHWLGHLYENAHTHISIHMYMHLCVYLLQCVIGVCVFCFCCKRIEMTVVRGMAPLHYMHYVHTLCSTPSWWRLAIRL